MRERRVTACDKFAAKCLGSTRFSGWFPLKVQGRAGMRKGEAYVEEHARCNRLLNTPIFFMRRRLNGKEGKRYGERNSKYRDPVNFKDCSAGVRGRKNPQAHR